MKKTMRKIIPSVLMLLVSAMLVGTSTYAWFAMNNKVTTTGMTVYTKVGNNLAISATVDDDPTDNTNYQTSMVTELTAFLEPASSVDGLDSAGNRHFYWTSTTNVNASNGDAISDIYVNYDGSNGAAFNTNYGTSGAVPYADYTFTLKANNTDSARYLDVIALSLTYGGTDAQSGTAAFRAALLVEKWNGSAFGTQTSKTVLKPSAGTYLTTTPSASAVNSTSTLGAVSLLNQPATIDDNVSSSGASYYRVTIRLWLEGEDTHCTLDTFSVLNDNWQLDVTIALQNSTEHTTTSAPVEALAVSTTVSKLDLTAAPVSAAEGITIDSTTYYPITGNTSYYLTTASTAVAYNSTVYQLIDSNRHPVDVTNQCALPKAVLTSAPTSGSSATEVNGTNYYAIAGFTDLYLTEASTAVSSSSKVYMIRGGVAVDVTDNCTLPS